MLRGGPAMFIGGTANFKGGPAKRRSGPAMFGDGPAMFGDGPASQQTRKDRKVMGWVAQPAIWWPSRLYGGGLQDFSVSPSPLLG